MHQERNVLDKLRKRDRAEGISHFKRLREAQGQEAGEEAFEELLDFVSERNAAAAIALQERVDALLCVLSAQRALHAQRDADQHEYHRKSDSELESSYRQCEALAGKENNGATLDREWDAVG